MKVLTMEQMLNVAGGDLGVNVTASVPDSEKFMFANVLGQFLVGNLDARTLGDALNSNPGAFDDMPINQITVGNFVISRV